MTTEDFVNKYFEDNQKEKSNKIDAIAGYKGDKLQDERAKFARELTTQLVSDYIKQDRFRTDAVNRIAVNQAQDLVGKLIEKGWL